MKKKMINTECPWCMKDIKVKNKYDIIICPKCKKRILPCAVCEENNFQYSSCNPCYFTT